MGWLSQYLNQPSRKIRLSEECFPANYSILLSSIFTNILAFLLGSTLNIKIKDEWVIELLPSSVDSKAARRDITCSPQSSNTWLLTNTITIHVIITGSKGFFCDIYPFAILSDTTILYYSQASAYVFFGAVSVLVSAYWCHPTEGDNPIKDQGGNVFPQKVIKTGEGSRFPRIHN